MEQAKAAVQDFTSKVGHHDTTVHEHARPAVTNEHITPTRHENVTTAVDKEVHQDHYHTTVQPVNEKEILPEKHTHNIIPIEHKKHHHGSESAVKERLQEEAAQFRNTTETGSTKHTQSVNPVVGGEHVHHHVHETIQPVIQKETIQPSVIHTTIPIHEVHHNEAKHHAATALPAVSLEEFKKQGGSLTGRDEKIDRFEGQPSTETKAQHSNHGGIHHHGHGAKDNSGALHSRDDDVASTGSTRQGTAGPHGDLGNKLDPRVDSDLDGSRTLPRDKTHAGASEASTSTDKNVGYGNNAYQANPRETTSGSTGGSTTVVPPKHKASLLDKLNPLKDSDGDGKKGFMK